MAGMKKFLMAAGGGTLLGLLATTQVAGPLVAQEAERNASVYEQLDLFGDIFERIRAEYVEEVEPDQLIEAAIDGMLTSLDPHSSYLSPEDAADMRFQTRGEFGGLGIEVTQEEGWVKVVSPMDGTPADAAGIQAGDLIVAVDGANTLGLTLDEAVEMMRGPVGSEIIITVVREGEDQPFDVSIIRDTIKLTAVRARTEGTTVVLRVSTFNDQTLPNLTEGLNEQIEEAGGIDNVEGVVLDLRNNPGGLLNQAIAVTDLFLGEGEIVSTRGRAPARSWKAGTFGTLPTMPMVVVGTRTFGKGSVQSIYDLTDGSGLKLTISHYFTPDGRSIQARGLDPDVYVAAADAIEPPPPGTVQREADLERRLDNPERTPSTADGPPAAPADPVLARAVEVLRVAGIFSQRP